MYYVSVLIYSLINFHSSPNPQLSLRNRSVFQTHCFPPHLARDCCTKFAPIAFNPWKLGAIKCYLWGQVIMLTTWITLLMRRNRNSIIIWNFCILHTVDSTIHATIQSFQVKGLISDMLHQNLRTNWMLQTLQYNKNIKAKSGNAKIMSKLH